MKFKLKFFFFFIVLISIARPTRAEINEFKNKTLTARVFVDIPSYQIDIKSKTNSNHVMWKPNLRALNGVDVYLNGFIGAGISWATNVDSEQSRTKGDSNYIDYRASMTLRSFRIEGNYQSYRGFYADNTGAIDPATWATGVYLQDRDMVGNNISANATFVLHPEAFSYTAAVGQDSRQESSGGSLLVGLAASKTEFSSSSPLIPSTIRSTFGDDQNIKSARFYGLIGKVGYGYTFAWTKNWFTTLIGDIGLGGEYREYGNGTLSTSAGGSSAKIDAVIAFGYNGDDFLAAFVATGDLTNYTTQSLEIPETIGDAKIIVGAHF